VGRNGIHQRRIAISGKQWNHAALFDNFFPAEHNSSPYFLKRTIAFAGSRGKKSDAGRGFLP
jgi:hypothetical protein